MYAKNNIEKITDLEEVYDKHASLMYGCIYRLVEKKETAEQILKQIFVDLHNREEYKTVDINNTFWYTKHALQTAIAFLKSNPSAAFNLDTVMQNTGIVSTNKLFN